MNSGQIPPFYDAFQTAPTVQFRWIGEAWKLFTARIGLWIGVVFSLLAASAIVMLGIIAIAAVLDTSDSSSGGDTAFSWDILLGGDVLIGAPYVLCALLFSPAAYRMAVRQARGETVGWEDLFRVGPIFGRMLGFWALAGGLIGGGLALAVIPGLLLAGLLLPAPAMIADGTGIFEAISRSIGVMSKGWLPAMGLALLGSALLGLGLVPCGLGLLAAQPLVWLLSAVAYRDAFGLADALPVPDFGTAETDVWPPPPRANPGDRPVPPPPPPTLFQ